MRVYRAVLFQQLFPRNLVHTSLTCQMGLKRKISVFLVELTEKLQRPSLPAIFGANQSDHLVPSNPPKQNQNPVQVNFSQFYFFPNILNHKQQVTAHHTSLIHTN
uniref:(northern house mosquito) hypothetical protein n=1 Tax=Culex pipiens TaxID=7175 RepID=A0A8D8AF30_CULPI